MIGFSEENFLFSPDSCIIAATWGTKRGHKIFQTKASGSFYPREPSLGHPGPVNVIELMLVLLRIPTIYGTVTATISRITVLKTGGIRKNEEKKMFWLQKYLVTFRFSYKKEDFCSSLAANFIVQYPAIIKYVIRRQNAS